jgi:hypothetical protein
MRTPETVLLQPENEISEIHLARDSRPSLNNVPGSKVMPTLVAALNRFAAPVDCQFDRVSRRK